MGGSVLKQPFPEILVQHAVLVEEGPDKEFRAAVTVDVGSIDSHAGPRVAGHVVSGAADVRDVAEASAARIQKRKFGLPSLVTNRSTCPSPLRSAATTPCPRPRPPSTPASLPASRKLPSPTLW